MVGCNQNEITGNTFIHLKGIQVLSVLFCNETLFKNIKKNKELRINMLLGFK